MSFPDEEINSLGKTRKKIVESFDDQIFMLDDDITNLYYLLPDKVVNTYKFRSEEGNFFRILAVWQILHEIAIELNTNIITSNIHLRDFIIFGKNKFSQIGMILLDISQLSDKL